MVHTLTPRGRQVRHADRDLHHSKTKSVFLRAKTSHRPLGRTGYCCSRGLSAS